MIIGIDGNEANIGKRVGIGEYGFQLLRQLKEFSAKSLKFQIYLKCRQENDMPAESEDWKYRVLTPGKLWTQWRLPLDLYLHKPYPDVFFSPTHYAPRWAPVPTVISIMDLSYLYFPELFKKTDLYQLRNWTAYSVKQAKKILTISESSKFDIIKEYKITEDKVEVIYPGVKPIINKGLQENFMDSIKAKYNISENFILFVGTLQPRKNINRLIEAFSKVLNSENVPVDLELIIIGKRGWLYEEILKKPEELGLKRRVRFLEGVGDGELSVFYKKALVFVLPSLYEGFGLPVLEAMQYGCPVITSNISSLPEAGGSAAIYVDPEDVEDIAEKIETVITSPDLRRGLIEKGKKQLEKFSWEKAAKETLAVLEKVVKENVK